MPRADWNTAHKRARHHKKMRSGSHGKGHSAKMRRAKMVIAEAARGYHPPKRKNGKPRREEE